MVRRQSASDGIGLASQQPFVPDHRLLNPSHEHAARIKVDRGGLVGEASDGERRPSGEIDDAEGPVRVQNDGWRVACAGHRAAAGGRVVDRVEAGGANGVLLVGRCLRRHALEQVPDPGRLLLGYQEVRQSLVRLQAENGRSYSVGFGFAILDLVPLGQREGLRPGRPCTSGTASRSRPY
jgi:hypothetical protein